MGKYSHAPLASILQWAGNALYDRLCISGSRAGIVTGELKPVEPDITADASNPNTGVIKDGGLSVRYCLNSNLTGLAATATGKYAMVYGVPSCYEVGLFSDYTVRVSEDYAFQKRMLAILGEVSIGGNVTVKNGFVRVKKAGA